MKTTLTLLRSVLMVMLITCSSCSLDSLFGTSGTEGNGALSEAQVITGLKEALTVGIDTASNHLNKVNGYLLNNIIKILLPPDVSTALDYVEALQIKISPITTTLSLAGVDVFNFSVFNGIRDSMMVSMNRAAEKAAPLSVDIFKNAITDMTIVDGISILKGDSVAATSYLKTKTFEPLTTLFEPFVENSLAQVGAQVVWQHLSTNYNAVATFYYSIPAMLRTSTNLPVLPFEVLDTDLSLYTTQKALSGLFYSVGEQENLIRTDPLAQVTDILRTVFGSLGD